MSNYLSNIVNKHFGPVEKLRPRLPGWFEPWPVQGAQPADWPVVAGVESSAANVTAPGEAATAFPTHVEKPQPRRPEPVLGRPAVTVEPPAATSPAPPHVDHPKALSPDPGTGASVKPVTGLARQPVDPAQRMEQGPVIERIVIERERLIKSKSETGGELAHRAEPDGRQSWPDPRTGEIIEPDRRAAWVEAGPASSTSPEPAPLRPITEAGPARRFPLLEPSLPVQVMPPIPPGKGQVEAPMVAPPPTIQVSIGRIEVWASQVAAPPPPKGAAPAVMSLDDYLRRRRGDER